MNTAHTFTIEKIEKDIFLQLPSANRIVCDTYAKCFSVVVINGVSFGIAWASDLLQPTVLYNEKYDLVLIGIDRKVAAISKTGKDIVLCIGLSDFFLFFIETSIGFVIVTETTIIGINGNDLSISKYTGAPEIIAECFVVGDNFKVKCIDGAEYTL